MKFVFPVTCQLRLGKRLNVQPVQQRDELERLRRGDELAVFANEISVTDEFLNNIRARGRRAQA